MKSKKIKLASLVFDGSLYPRGDVDAQHVRYIQEAIRAGTEFPPIVICEKSKRIVDGVHRWKAYQQELGLDASVEVLSKRYKDGAELFLEAIRLNANHGRMLSTYDRAHIAVLADDIGIDPDQIASALNMTVAKFEIISVARCAKLNGKNIRTIPIKRTIQHMAGQRMTKAQSEANDKLGGMNQTFYINQLITLIEADLLDTENGELMKRLDKLRVLLVKVCSVAV